MLIVILLLQSFVGIADAYQCHPSNAPHPQALENSHNKISVTNAKAFNNPALNTPVLRTSADNLPENAGCPQDCKHCYYCHTLVHPALTVAPLPLSFTKRGAMASAYTVSYLTRLPQSLYRPPIA